MLDIKKSCVVPLRLLSKLPKNDRPSTYQLYQFFVGDKSQLPKATRRKIAKIIEEDFNKMKDYLLHD